jgi:hypothetical protein
MKSHLKSLLVAVLAFGGGQLRAVPVTLHDFASFLSPNTFFTGDWELNGSPGGSDQPKGTFLQDFSAFAFAGGSNDEFSGAYYFFGAPLDITGLSQLQLSADVLPDNTASTFAISLFDSLGESAFALFSTADFAVPGFSTVAADLTFSAGFNTADLSFFYLSGGAFQGTETLSFSFDHLAVDSPPPAVGVPDVSNVGLFTTLALGMLFTLRRSRLRLPAA